MLGSEQRLHFCILRVFTGIEYAGHFCKITRPILKFML